MENPAPINLATPPSLSLLVSRSDPLSSHLGQTTVFKLKDTGFLRCFHMSAEGTVSHPSAAAQFPAGKKRSCHRPV